ncbi:MAG: glycosyltransferase family 39 protein, partial [Betaproteobacteria bacterium]
MPFADVVASQNEPSELSPSGPYRTLKQAGLVLLCTAWIALGLFGHDPWNFDMLKSGDWIIPQLAGSALPERAPLFYALAAAAASAFQAVLPLHDAARIAIALCLGLTLWLLALTGRELYGPGFRWLPVLIFIGCIGLWDRSHQLSPDLGLLPAFALALYALALSQRRPALAGILLGGAAGVAFLFRGSLGPALIALTALLLPLFKPWRSTRYAGTLALAIVVAAPLIVAWPWALYLRDPVAFSQWFAAQDITRLFGLAPGAPESEPLYYARNLLWFAWPALPLGLWTLWLRSRGFNGGLGDAGVELPAVMSLVLFIVLSAAAEPRATLLLPLLLPLSLLAAAEVDTLKRGYSGALDWFGILTFGLLAALVWGLWIETLVNGLPEPV